MASISGTADQFDNQPVQRERRFYLAMACLIAALVVAGFGGYIIVGISSFHAPWWVHVHAVTYMGWIGLYLLQNIFVVRGDIARHMVLGRIMGFWAIWMVFVGSALLGLSIGAHRAPPPIFSAPFLVAMDEINVLLFALLVIAGLALRRRSDWHRRIMLTATISIIAPALGRLTQLLGGFSWLEVIVIQLVLVGVAMMFDVATRGRPHPALIVGALAIAMLGLIVPPAAELPFFVDLAAQAQSVRI